MEIIHKHFITIDSTNTWSKQHSHEFPRDKITLVTADGQTGGRGRFNRRWESPAGQNIYATFNFFVEKHRTDIGNIPQVLSISAARVLQSLGMNPKLKWPNDVLLSGKKAGGILCETTPYSDMLCVIIGIGLNVNMPLELLQQIDRPATSILVESGKSLKVQDVLKKLENQFSKDLDLFIEEGFYPYLEIYKGFLVHKADDRIRFHDNRTVQEGYFHSINNDGSLNLRLDSGEVKVFVAGEILY